jgi:hypothetical protein
LGLIHPIGPQAAAGAVEQQGEGLGGQVAGQEVLGDEVVGGPGAAAPAFSPS